MGSYIKDNFSELKQRHYIRKTGGRDYWFDFTHNRMQNYFESFGDDFCIVMYASDEKDDCYVIPYIDIKEVFLDTLLDQRNRWTGYIHNSILRVVRHPNSKVISVGAYYNNFDPLWQTTTTTPDELIFNDIFDNVDGDIDASNLKRLIMEFNRRYQDVIPYKRKAVSERVARPGAISDYLKRLCNYTCELCGEKGFQQLNGSPYIEAHHINELHELISGSYCSDNIIVVCPTCHKKLHYADVQYEPINNGEILITINKSTYRFERSLISQDNI